MSHDRGLYARCFEELFDLANSDATSTSRFSFSVSVFEIYNEQVLLPFVSEVPILCLDGFVMEFETSNFKQLSFSDQGFTLGN